MLVELYYLNVLIVLNMLVEDYNCVLMLCCSKIGEDISNFYKYLIGKLDKLNLVRVIKYKKYFWYNRRYVGFCVVFVFGVCIF